ncbi:carbohydrate sulfotransferase 3-like [Glandiceps talaboti]
MTLTLRPDVSAHEISSVVTSVTVVKKKKVPFGRALGKERLTKRPDRNIRHTTRRPDHVDTKFEKLPSSAIATSTSASSTSSRVAILVVARARTGSTFLGEFFNQHPGIFYLFEPLRSIPFMIKYDDLEEDKVNETMTNILLQLLTCNFTEEHASYKHLLNWPLTYQRSKTIQTFTGLDDVTKWRQIIGTPRVSDLHKMCVTHQHIAAKIIRIPDCANLKFIVQQGINLKVLFLVRDPRAVLVSIYGNLERNLTNIELFQSGDEVLLSNTTYETQNIGIFDAMHVSDYCNWLVSNFETIQNNDWLKRIVKIVRHEDLSLAPKNKADELYNFLNIGIHNDVYDWLDENAGAETQNSYKTMDTRRNSTALVFAWRLKILLSEVQDAQDVCADAMKLFGYRRFSTRQQLTNFAVPSIL